MPKSTVCFVCDAMLDLFTGEDAQKFGGSQAQMYLVAKHLAVEAEFGVRVVADRDVSGIQYPGISFRQVDPPVRRGVPYISRFTNKQRRNRPYADLEQPILFQTILTSATVDTAAVAREFGHKFVFRVSSDAEIDGSMYSQDEKERLHAALKQADGVISLTRAQQAALRSELGIESHVIPNIVEVPADVPETTGGYVLWVGRAAEIKRPWIMIETARVLPEIEFVMLMAPGSGFPHERLFWQAITKEATHIPNLRIIPGVPFAQMAEYYRDAVAVANTSAAEGFSNVFLQAAAQRTPIVSLDVDPDGMLEVEGAGRCADGDVDAFRVALLEYVRNPSDAHRAGSRGFEYVSRHHSPQEVLPVLGAFLRRVAGS